MLYRLLLYPLAAWMLTSTCFAQDPAATSASASNETVVTFSRLDNYLKTNPVEFETSFDARADGDELYRGSGQFVIRQPNLLLAKATFGPNIYSVVSDGTVLTIYDPQQRKFSQTAAPGSIGQAFSFFAGEIGVDSQVLNFLGVVDSVVAGTDGIKVTAAGSETIGGRQCDKFKVSDPTGDNRWEAWLEKSDTPLLCRLVYHNVDGPTQTNEFTWKSTPTITQATFVFLPPAGSSKVDVGSLNLVAPD
jgi:hypothetical protein